MRWNVICWLGVIYGFLHSLANSKLNSTKAFSLSPPKYSTNLAGGSMFDNCLLNSSVRSEQAMCEVGRSSLLGLCFAPLPPLVVMTLKSRQ